MNPLKERITTTKAITTLLTSVLVASFAGTMISMPQMMGSVYAQSGQGSENACGDRGELQNGRCVEPATETTTFTCASVFGQTPTPTGTPKTCTATTTTKAGTETNAAITECENAGGTATVKNGSEPSTKDVTCKYPAKQTTIFTCPGGIVPTPDTHLCITKPGNRA